MTTRLTIKDLERLKQEGKIRGYVDKKGGLTKRETPGKSKYKNKKVVYDDIEFDSIKEGKRYLELRMLRNAGEITDLQLQVEFELNEGGTHSLKYVADFVYCMDGERIVEDVKGFRTAIYKKKKRLMKEVYGIEILEK